MARLRAAVIGGSLGGLSAALWLRDAGLDVEVFERSDAELSDRGAGLLLHPAASRYLTDRAARPIEGFSASTRRVLYLDRDGGTVFEDPIAYSFASWNSLYRPLLEAFGTERYHLGHRLVALDQDADGATVRFAGGEEMRCDLVVCADGIGSTARGQLLPDAKPVYAGYVAWRGTVPEAELDAETFRTLHDTIAYHVMADSHILVYPIPGVDGSVEPGRRLMNFVWYRNVPEGAELDALMTDRSGVRRPISLPPGAVRQPFADALHADGAALPCPIADIVTKTETPFLQAIVDVESPRMAFGRLCLIGDAAFAARPHAAAGSAKAADDARALGEAFADTSRGVAETLERWEPERLEVGSNLVARTRDVGNRSQVEGTYRPGDPSLRFGLLGPGR